MKAPTSILYNAIKNKIRELIYSKNLTQNEIVSKMGRSQQIVNKMLNKNKDMTITNMEKLADVIGVNYSELLPLSIIQNNAEGSKDNVQIKI